MDLAQQQQQPNPKERGYIIHLPSAQERLPLIHALQSSFPVAPLEIRPASNGEAWLRDPALSKRHIHGGSESSVTQGMLGCAQSHLEILYREYKAGTEYLWIFEDDCELVAEPHAIQDWVAMARTPAAGLPDWDLLLLGATEYVELARAPPQFIQVNRFWGTHAMLVRPRAMRAALKVFAEAQRNRLFLPADWMWNEAIRREGLIALGPNTPQRFCRQAPGLVSAITGHIRLGKV
jgi:GR25 family glycosyltransferase involved in LPS biosynthesis